MKYFIYIMLVLGVGLVVFNIFQLDFEDIFDDKSISALIGVLASLCVVVLMLILLVSRRIKQKSERKS